MPTFADMFAGIGGFRLGLEKVGCKCVFSCEIDPVAKRVYKENFKDIPFDDVRKVQKDDLPDFDILCAGFPCQPFSISGLRKGFKDNKNGNLFYEIIRIAKLKNPKILFLENVKNYARHDKGKTFKTTVNLIEEIGYTPFYKIINSKYYGVAQNRERFFIVAIRKDIDKTFEFPEPEDYPIITLEDILEEHADEKLFYKGNDVTILKEDIKHKIHKPYQIAYVRHGRQGERIYSVKGTSITISFSTGGVFPKTGGYWTKQGIRKLTVNECKKLFGFPNEFSFDNVSYNRAIALLGNSVVVNVIEAIGKKIIKDILTR